MNSYRNWAAIFLLGVLAFGTVCLGQTETQSTYVSKCQPCHGPTGAGDTPMGKKLGVVPYSSEDVVKSSDASLLAILKYGKDKMPPFEHKLTDDQRKALIVYIRTLTGK